MIEANPDAMLAIDEMIRKRAAEELWTDYDVIPALLVLAALFAAESGNLKPFREDIEFMLENFEKLSELSIAQEGASTLQ